MVYCCYTRRIELDGADATEGRATEAARDSFGWRVALDNATIVAVFPGGPYEKCRKNVKKCENYSGRFPEGVQKEEIQQCRQARSRPGEKETHNIKLRE